MVYNSCGVILAGLANFAVQTVTPNFNGVQQYNSRGCFQFHDGSQPADAHIGPVVYLSLLRYLAKKILFLSITKFTRIHTGNDFQDDRLTMISSVTPSGKYSGSSSLLMFLNGMTSMVGKLLSFILLGSTLVSKNRFSRPPILML